MTEQSITARILAIFRSKEILEDLKEDEDFLTWGVIIDRDRVTNTYRSRAGCCCAN
jgi:hypothetical protein